MSFSFVTRKRLALTTAIVSVAIGGYGRRAYAVCNTVGTTVTCTGNESNGISSAAGGDFDGTTTTDLNINNLTTDITSGSGDLTGDGVYFNTGFLATQDITINSDLGPFVIDAYNDGFDVYAHGNITINHTGNVTAQNGYGFDIQSGYENVNIITTGDVQSHEHGFYVRAYSGTIDVVHVGNVTSDTADGFYLHGEYGVDVTVTGDITAGHDGIRAYAHVANDAVVTVYGNIDAGHDGLEVFSYNNSIIKVVGDIDAVETGINVYAYDGTIAITVDGDVTGVNHDGVLANAHGGGDITITVDGGTIEGFDNSVEFVDGGANLLTNRGVVTNSFTDVARMAIRGGDADETIDNYGNIRGNIDLGSGANAFNNRVGSLFESGEIVDLDGGTFQNWGTVSPGGTFNILTTTLTGDFVGTNGRLVVDAVLAPGSQSDQLIIDGNSSGTTNLVINPTNPLSIAPNFDGITVVTVNGTTAEEDFNLEGGVLNAGFFAWGLFLEGNTHELRTTGLGAGSVEFAAGITGAQDMWYQTTGVLSQRQADLRLVFDSANVTPVADFSQPVEPTPVGHVTPGAWFKGVGTYLEREASEGVLNLDRDQTVFSILGGFDFGTENIGGQGDALMFGVLGGYLTSDLNFDATDTKWNYEGPTVGVYATYLNHAFHFDALVKADFLDVDIDTDGTDADTDVVNIGGQIDTGYKVDLVRNLFVEPQATLAVVHTEVDDIDDIFGGAVDFDDETSVRGRLGLRFGSEIHASNATIYSSDVIVSVWQEFNGDNNVTILAPLFPTTGVSDDPGGTFGDVSIGFNVISQDGWSGFLRGNWQFAEDFDALSGNAGVRYVW